MTLPGDGYWPERADTPGGVERTHELTGAVAVGQAASAYHRPRGRSGGPHAAMERTRATRAGARQGGFAGVLRGAVDGSRRSGGRSDISRNAATPMQGQARRAMDRQCAGNAHAQGQAQTRGA